MSQVDFSTTALWTDQFPIAGCLVSFYYYCFIEIPIDKASSIDTDQMLHSAASVLGLRYLPNILLVVSD